VSNQYQQQQESPAGPGKQNRAGLKGAVGYANPGDASTYWSVVRESEALSWSGKSKALADLAGSSIPLSPERPPVFRTTASCSHRAPRGFLAVCGCGGFSRSV